MRMYKLTALLWEFNALLDSGEHDTVTVADVKRRIREGVLPTYLQTQFPNSDFSTLEPEDWRHLMQEWESFADHMDEKRKMSVVNRGLCLLLGYTINSLQQHPENPRNQYKDRLNS